MHAGVFSDGSTTTVIAALGKPLPVTPLRFKAGAPSFGLRGRLTNVFSMCVAGWGRPRRKAHNPRTFIRLSPPSTAPLFKDKCPAQRGSPQLRVAVPSSVLGESAGAARKLIRLSCQDARHGDLWCTTAGFKELPAPQRRRPFCDTPSRAGVIHDR